LCFRLLGLLSSLKNKRNLSTKSEFIFIIKSNIYNFHFEGDYNMGEMDLFLELKQRKVAGESITFESSTKEILEQLWVKEIISDEAIAHLFSVTKSVIISKREEWGIK
jgi:hypothetical protein